jgi:hypothetical protein
MEGPTVIPVVDEVDYEDDSDEYEEEEMGADDPFVGFFQARAQAFGSDAERISAAMIQDEGDAFGGFFDSISNFFSSIVSAGKSRKAAREPGTPVVRKERRELRDVSRERRQAGGQAWRASRRGGEGAPAPAQGGAVQVNDDDGYVYQRDESGTITIVAGPKGVGTRHTPGSQFYDVLNAVVEREVAAGRAGAPTMTASAPAARKGTSSAAPSVASIRADQAAVFRRQAAMASSPGQRAMLLQRAADLEATVGAGPGAAESFFRARGRGERASLLARFADKAMSASDLNLPGFDDDDDEDEGGGGGGGDLPDSDDDLMQDEG